MYVRIVWNSLLMPLSCSSCDSSMSRCVATLLADVVCGVAMMVRPVLVSCLRYLSWFCGIGGTSGRPILVLEVENSLRHGSPAALRASPKPVGDHVIWTRRQLATSI